MLGFHPLPAGFFAALAVMDACYLVLTEVGKRLFYGVAPAPTGPPALPVGHRHLRRRAAYFSTNRQRGLELKRPWNVKPYTKSGQVRG